MFFGLVSKRLAIFIFCSFFRRGYLYIYLDYYWCISPDQTRQVRWYSTTCVWCTWLEKIEIQAAWTHTHISWRAVVLVQLHPKSYSLGSMYVCMYMGGGGPVISRKDFNRGSYQSAEMRSSSYTDIDFPQMEKKTTLSYWDGSLTRWDIFLIFCWSFLPVYFHDVLPTYMPAGWRASLDLCNNPLETRYIYLSELLWQRISFPTMCVSPIGLRNKQSRMGIINRFAVPLDCPNRHRSWWQANPWIMFPPRPVAR